MKAAVIIVTYNNENDALDAIDSIRRQSFTDWQCIIIDNGSTDTTFELVKNNIAGDHRFSAFQKENEGPSAGRNCGFAKLEKDTQYVHFLDGDDMLHSDFLSIMISYLDQHPEVGLLGCQYNKVDKTGNFLQKGHRSRYHSGFLGVPQNLKSSIYNTPFESFFSATGQGSFAMYRVNVLARTTGFEESFWSHEDSDMFCQMSLLAEVHYLPLRLYNVRIRQNSLTQSKKLPRNRFRDKWDLYQSEVPGENELIERALRYYYMRHKPMRDFKVSMKAFRRFLKTRNLHQLKWSFECLQAGIKDVLFRSSFKNRMSQRRKQKT